MANFYQQGQTVTNQHSNEEVLKEAVALLNCCLHSLSPKDDYNYALFTQVENFIKEYGSK